MRLDFFSQLLDTLPVRVKTIEIFDDEFCNEQEPDPLIAVSTPVRLRSGRQTTAERVEIRKDNTYLLHKPNLL
jgi:hypothetical protein